MFENATPNQTLAQVVQKRPFPDYLPWWPMGDTFLRFMSNAIFIEWQLIPQRGKLAAVQQQVTRYIEQVYGKTASPTLVERFTTQDFSQPLHSGEFDALSYAFYRSAFLAIGSHFSNRADIAAQARRRFTQRVGKRFFNDLHNHLRLDLPTGLQTAVQFTKLKENIALVGLFLQQQGYLREQFSFSFSVFVTHQGQKISQDADDVVQNLRQTQLVHALYTMGYPAILPSAVYLYQMLGEAQHHSSRTIEELFARVGLVAQETADFDPTDFPSDDVVELWEIRPNAA